MDNTQNIISFCTGYGGIELGIKRTGLDVRTVAYVEIEAFACANLVSKIEQGKMDAAPIWTDLKTFDGRPFHGKVDGIIGGYPCQPFSNAGLRAGAEDPRHLWPYIEKHIRTINPVWCFFENVGGHLTLGFQEVFQSLRGLGYKVEAGLFTAAEVGAPHKRERLFILAYAEGCRLKTWSMQNRANKRFIQEDQRNDRRDLRVEITGCGSELANSQSSNRRLLIPERRQVQTLSKSGGPSTKELDDPQHNGSSTTKGPRSTCKTVCNPEKREDVTRDATGASKPGELAHPNSEGTQRSKDSGTAEGSGQNGHQQLIRQDCWPARPGQEQYGWECPRTLPVTKGPKPTSWDEYKARIANAAQSELGGTTDGITDTLDAIANRVDRLRLGGNGVVPQTAELAFRTLWNKMGLTQ